MAASNSMFADILTSTRHFVGWMVLIAFIMVASIPAGFMPGKIGNGFVSVTICSGSSEKTVLVDANTGMPDSSHPHSTKTPLCDILGTLMQGQLDISASGVTIPAPILIILRLIGMPRDSIVRDLHNAAYVPRGPPQLTV